MPETVDKNTASDERTDAESSKVAKDRTNRIAARKRVQQRAEDLAKTTRNERKIAVLVESPEGSQVIAVDAGHSYPNVDAEKFIQARKGGDMNELHSSLSALDKS